MLPLLAKRQQFRLNILDIFPLISGSQPDQIGHGGLQRQFVPGTHVLTRHGQLGVCTTLVTHGVDPMLAPVGPEPGPDVGREAHTYTDRSRRALGQSYRHGNHAIHGLAWHGINIDP
ncbi:hypothetical protein AU14_13020 [Marinobacter similis]|uniref:Uncharacterized protein n=1 Tax=Marinobacter similis TaxID=1420916 RepID=W5YLQ3_9GAMM|nr:hypothetical protein AU14_13020 [Marinobacter similis]